MLKFKREDLGLYFAMGLVFGGAGLLVGAFVSNKLEQRRREKELEYLEEDWEAPDVHTEDSEEVVINPIVAKDKRGFGTLADPEAIELAREKSLKRRKQKDSERKKFHLSDQQRSELRRLIEEYEPTTIQIELVESGTMTLEDLEMSLLEEQFIEAEFEEEEDDPLPVTITEGQTDGDYLDHTDYSSQYRGYEDNKPDIDDLISSNDIGERPLEELLVVVDNRWEILLDEPKGKHQKNRKDIFFDPENESTYVLSPSDPDITIPVDIAVMISPEVKDLVWDFLLFEEVGTIYINDLEGPRWYTISKEGESVEDDSEEYLDD